MDDEIKKERPRLVKHKPVTSENTNEKPQNMKASNIFFLALFWAIGLVCIIKNVWILELLTIPFIIYLIKALLSWIGTNSVVHEQLDNARSKLELYAKERKDVLAPAPVRGIMRTVLLGDKKVQARCDFLPLIDVIKRMTYGCSNYGSYSQSIHNYSLLCISQKKKIAT